MDKPQKPRSGGFAGFLNSLFPRKQKASYRSGYTNNRQARSDTSMSTGPMSSRQNTTGIIRNLNSNTDPGSQQTGGSSMRQRSSTRVLPSQNVAAESVNEPAPGGNQPPPPPPPPPPNRYAAPQRNSSNYRGFLPIFWTIASVSSFTINIILIIALILVGRELFVLKALVGNNLLGGLYENFIYMDQAHIKTDITVSDTIPINFTLPISQDTVVTLTQSTPINNAHVVINTGGISINSFADIVLPKGTNLPVHLTMDVPVSTTVPVKLNVPVDIPLQNTDLHKPFIGLQQVVSPFYYMLQPQIKSPEDLPFCGPGGLCSFYFTK